MGAQHKISQDVKEQILKRVKEEGISVVQAAKDHGVSDKTIYRWLGKGVSDQPTWTEISKLKRENKMLMELIGIIPPRYWILMLRTYLSMLSNIWGEL